MKLKRSTAIAIAFFSAFILAGCDNNDKPQEAQAARRQPRQPRVKRHPRQNRMAKNSNNWRRAVKASR
jgi:hypothetical protein